MWSSVCGKPFCSNWTFSAAISQYIHLFQQWWTASYKGDWITLQTSLNHSWPWIKRIHLFSITAEGSITLVLTLVFQHLVSLCNLGFTWKTICPAVQQLNNLFLDRFWSQVAIILFNKSWRIISRRTQSLQQIPNW